MDELKEVVDSTDKKFLYAENFVYATPVQKALRSSAQEEQGAVHEG